MREIWLAKELLASLEEFCYMDFSYSDDAAPSSVTRKA